MKARLPHAAPIHLQGTGRGKAQAAASRRAETAEITEGGQIAQVEGQIQFARLATVQQNARGTGVAIHEQVRYRAQAQGAQKIRPPRRPQARTVPELAAVGLQVVDGIGAARQAPEHFFDVLGVGQVV